MILDYYDDFTNELLSPFIKEAELPEKDKSKLKDSDFALILVYPDHVSRYYPIHSEIDTKLSLDYFTKTAGKLPPNARLVAAYHLAKAAEGFGLSIPGYIKAVLEQQKSIPVEDNKVVIDHEPVDEDEIADNQDYLIPGAKMLPIRPDNLDHYIKNFDQIVANLDSELSKEAAFNLIRFIIGQGKKDVKLNTNILKLAQEYAAEKVGELKKKKEEIKTSKIEKLAHDLPLEWDRLNYEQRKAVASVINKKASAGEIVIPVKVKVLISDYVNHEVSPITFKNITKRANMIIQNSFEYEVQGKSPNTMIKLLKNAAYLAKQGDVKNGIETIKNFDKEAELERLYGVEIDDPYVTFSKGINSVFTRASSFIPRQPEAVFDAPQIQKIAEMLQPRISVTPQKTRIIMFKPAQDPLIDIMSQIATFFEDFMF